MPKLIILGTAHAIPDEYHENTYLAFVGERRRVLIDCAGNPQVRLKKADIDLLEVTDMFLTHFHPDHVSGVPSLLTNMWLMGRHDPLEVYGLQVTLDRVIQLMGLFEWDQWPDFFPVNFHPLPLEPLTLAIQDEDLRIFTSPVEHSIPSIGLRMEARQTGSAIAYSGDTSPCDAVVELAEGAAVLIHEATGQHPGHASASQAGIIAARADVGKLYLIHYDPQDESLVSQAQKEFPGPVALAEDFMTFRL
jgi:ribonuclease Z